jgi:hypothetical protein
VELLVGAPPVRAGETVCASYRSFEATAACSIFACFICCRCTRLSSEHESVASSVPSEGHQYYAHSGSKPRDPGPVQVAQRLSRVEVRSASVACNSRKADVYVLSDGCSAAHGGEGQAAANESGSGMCDVRTRRRVRVVCED